MSPKGQVVIAQITHIMILGYYKITIHRRNSMLGEFETQLKPVWNAPNLNSWEASLSCNTLIRGVLVPNNMRNNNMEWFQFVTLHLKEKIDQCSFL